MGEGQSIGDIIKNKFKQAGKNVGKAMLKKLKFLTPYIATGIASLVLKAWKNSLTKMRTRLIRKAEHKNKTKKPLKLWNCIKAKLKRFMQIPNKSARIVPNNDAPTTLAISETVEYLKIPE